MAEFENDASLLDHTALADLHGQYFLLKNVGHPSAESGPLGFKTLLVRPSTALAHGTDYAQEPSMAVIPVKKRLCNPWPNMLSIGRARSCDIVLRYTNISKLHAIIRLSKDGLMRLNDQGSANGTTINGDRVRDPTVLHLGDIISFGGLECEFVDASTLIEISRKAS